MDEFLELANRICEYCMKRFVVPYLRDHGFVQSYRAKVVSVDSGAKTMIVKQPFDEQITLPYGNSAASLSAGDECIVFCLGDSSNAVVVSDGMLNL